MTVEQYRQMLERHQLQYKVVGDNIRVFSGNKWLNASELPKDIVRLTKQMKPQLLVAANPILAGKKLADAKTASSASDVNMHQAKNKIIENWVAKKNREMNEAVLGMLHGVESGKTGAKGVAGHAANYLSPLANVAEFLYPTSVVGKTLEAAPLALAALPEEAGLAGTAAVGTILGGGAGAVSGEGTLGGVAQGMLLPASEAYSQYPDAASKLWKYFTKHKELKKLYNRSLNEVVAGIVGKNSRFGQAILKGKLNWAKYITGADAFQEAAHTLGSEREAIAERMHAAVMAENEHDVDVFKNKWKGVDKNDESLIGQMISEKKAMAEKIKERMANVKSYHEAIDEVGKLNRVAYKGGKAAESGAAAGARRQIASLHQHINETLSKFDPSLADEYKEADKKFAQFMSLKTLAGKDIWDEGKGLIEPQKLQGQVLGSVKQLQQGLGNAFGPFFETVGRHADLMKEGQETDLPGAIERVRAMGHGLTRMFVSVPAEILTHGPMPKYAGQAEANLLRKTAPETMDATQQLLKQPPLPKHPIATTVGNTLLQSQVDKANEPADASSQ